MVCRILTMDSYGCPYFSLEILWVHSSFVVIRVTWIFLTRVFSGVVDAASLPDPVKAAETKDSKDWSAGIV